jgi:hypothetical protein
MNEKIKIEPKDLLDISWKYFQQHAQQRISYFNFFVVFSALVTSGLISTFQEKFEAHYVGLFLGICQMVISCIFWKIDTRNKFLTKHSESVIRRIEGKYIISPDEPESESFALFSLEEKETQILRESQKKMCFIKRQFSHSICFRLIYIFFFIMGLSGFVISCTLQYKDSGTKLSKESIIIMDNKSDTIKIVHK